VFARNSEAIGTDRQHVSLDGRVTARVRSTHRDRVDASDAADRVEHRRDVR
jgi:hypothetical protein